MSEQKLKPGIYKATVRGQRDQVVLVDDAGDYATISKVCGWWGHEDRHITDARPLIVLDLKGMKGAGFLTGFLREQGHDWIADQIEDQIPEPPRIPEPYNLGSLVTAAQVGECDGSERVWTRFSHARTACWIDSLGHIRSWQTLTDPEPYPFGGH